MYSATLNKLRQSLITDEISLAKRKISVLNEKHIELKKLEDEHKQLYDNLAFSFRLESDSPQLQVFFDTSWEVLFRQFEQVKLKDNEEVKLLEAVIEKTKQEIMAVHEEAKKLALQAPSAEMEKELAEALLSASPTESKLASEQISNRNRATTLDSKSFARQTLLMLLMESKSVSDKSASQALNQELHKFLSAATLPSCSQQLLYNINNVQGFINYFSDMIVSYLNQNKDIISALEPREIYEVIEYVLFTRNNRALYTACMAKCIDSRQDEEFNLQRNSKQVEIIDALFCDSAFFAALASTASAATPTEKLKLFQGKFMNVIALFSTLSNPQATPTPTMKLALITRVCKLAMNVMSQLALHAKQTKVEGAISMDDFLPILICILSCATSIDDVCSQMQFIKQFANDELSVCSEFAFYLTTLESSVYFIQNFGKIQQQQTNSSDSDED